MISVGFKRVSKKRPCRICGNPKQSYRLLLKLEMLFFQELIRSGCFDEFTVRAGYFQCGDAPSKTVIERAWANATTRSSFRSLFKSPIKMLLGPPDRLNPEGVRIAHA
jgi:hypothetical protein